MPRYRLRFLLQEFDLSGPQVTIGRSPDCDVTIDDPLMSREHVRIELHDDGALIVDTHSRNGVLLNDQPVVHKAALHHDDRLCLGTQQMVFVVGDDKKKRRRTTGGISFCGGCKTPFASAAPRCPHCSASNERAGETTVVKPSGAGWTFGILRDVVDRALDEGRYAHAERILKRGAAELEAQLGKGETVDTAHVAGIAGCASRLGHAIESGFWTRCGERLYDKAGIEPPKPKERRLRIQGV